MTIAEFDERLAEWVGHELTVGGLVWALANDKALYRKLCRMVEAEEVRLEAEHNED